MRYLGAVVLALVMAACQPPEDRTAFEEYGFSIHSLPEDWQSSPEKGSVVLRAHGVAALERVTIVIRSVLLEDPRKGSRSPADVISSTGHVLGALPSARLGDGHSVSHGVLKGKAWRLSFVPPGKRMRYERRHTVLVGQRRAFHILVTAPEGALAPAVDLFDAVVQSIQEEA